MAPNLAPTLALTLVVMHAFTDSVHYAFWLGVVPEEELSGEIWYTVNKGDVFPETFGPFLLGNTQVREIFMAHHAELLDPAFWQGCKERILAGHVHDVFPYEPSKRFAVRRQNARIAASTKEPVHG